jgi:hypothetical protein
MADMKLTGSDAIDAAVLDSLRRHAGRKTEPHLVAAIFRDLAFRSAIVKAVEPEWHAVNVRTVFVHATPKVTFSCAKASCELGDALVVYRERLGVGQRRRQAVLFQAKIWKGNGRSWVATVPDQHALYRHWPPFKILGGPPQEIRLPPGDYGRVLGLTSNFQTQDVPRVSPRRPTRPGCVREAHPWSETMGTLGKAIRGVVRFEVGERVDGDWATAVADMVGRVGPTSAGKTFPPVPRGGSSGRRRAARASTDADVVEAPAPVDELDALLDGASDLPPEEDVTFDEGERPLSILLIDIERPQ